MLAAVERRSLPAPRAGMNCLCLDNFLFDDGYCFEFCLCRIGKLWANTLLELR